MLLDIRKPLFSQPADLSTSNVDGEVRRGGGGLALVASEGQERVAQVGE